LGPPDIVDSRRFLQVLNVPKTIATAVSSEVVTLSDLATALSLEDLWDALEIVAVNRHNESILQREQTR